MSVSAQTGRSAQSSISVTLWLLIVISTLALLTAGILWPTPAILEAWLFAFLVFAGLASASLGLLMIGHLLGDVWLEPIRDELEPAAWTMPLIGMLAIPLALNLGPLYPWARGDVAGAVPSGRLFFLEPDFFLVRGVVYLVVWTVLAWIVTRAGEHRGASAVGLAFLAPTVSLAAIDWVMSRDPYWWSSLFGFAYAVSQLTAALAAAFLVTMIRQDHPDTERMQSLERALLTLALLTFWVWFSQFLIVWMGNLPDEVAWYHARARGWAWTLWGIALPALVIAIVIMIPSRVRRQRLSAAAALLLVQYVAHMMWLVRPSAPQPGLTWSDLIVPLAVTFVWGLWFIAGLRRYPRIALSRRRS